MATLARERCLNHPGREAVCRCPSCRNFFCRECVALFESRLLCAECLAAELNSQEGTVANQRFGIASAAFALIGFLLAWLLFYFAGWSILQLRDHAVAQLNHPAAKIET